MKKNIQSGVEHELAPKCDYRVSHKFTGRVMDTAAEMCAGTGCGAKRSVRHGLQWRMTAVVMCLAIAVCGILAVSRPGAVSANAAGSLFARASAYLDHVDGYELSFRVRTRDSENFSYTNPAIGFVEHNMVVVADGRWRIDKGGRVAELDGKNVWVWFPDKSWGWKMDAESAGSVLEQFSPLSDLKGIMDFLEGYASERGDVRFTRRDRGDEVILTLKAPALGNFDNPYSRFSSVEEMDTRQTYVFNAGDGRLVSAKIDMLLLGMIPRTVMKLDEIKYDAVIAQSDMGIPAGIEWVDETSAAVAAMAEELPVEDYTGITADEAARRMFASMATWDEESLGVVLRSYPLGVLEKKYKGCELLECGRPFESGTYAGVFVPCRLRFADGSVERIRLAMRNDNELGFWNVDGGL